jgi:transcriptional regulator with XRE-family HTH domain
LELVNGFFMGIAERIVSERKRLGLSQAEFAKRAGVSLSSQKRYEKGERDPDSSYIEAIASIGVERLFLDSGSRLADYRSDRYAAAQWLLMELSDALALGRGGFQDELDKLDLAVRRMTKNDDSKEINALARSLVRSIFQKSPFLDVRVQETIEEVRISDYAAIVERFEAAQIALGAMVSPSKKAQSIAMLWRVLRSGGQVDPVMIEGAVKLAAGL